MKQSHGIRHTLIAFLILLFTINTVHADKKLAVDKVRNGLSVMVLGSGGPAAIASNRASAGYVVFTDDKPRILMDAGGGTFQRLLASGVNVKDLDIILLSHLHIDHTGDLSSIVKAAYFHSRAANLDPDIPQSFPPGRTAAFRIFGPDANGIQFPPATGLPAVPQSPPDAP